MKAIHLLLFVAVFIPISDCAAQTSPDRLDLTVEVKGIRNGKGNIRCILWGSADGFPRDIHRGVQRKEAEIQAGKATVAFTDVPAGQYAVSCIHDENLNRKFDSNFMGLPKEGYGFSNKAKGRLGPPSFEAAALTLSPATKPAWEVHLSY